MANNLALMKETITTLQSFPGPNKSLADSKNVVCVIDVEVQGEQTDVPGHYKMLDLFGYIAPTAVPGGEYTDSPLDTAEIGSMYRLVSLDGSGVPNGADLFIKAAKAGAPTDWKLVTKAA